MAAKSVLSFSMAGAEVENKEVAYGFKDIFTLFPGWQQRCSFIHVVITEDTTSQLILSNADNKAFKVLTLLLCPVGYISRSALEFAQILFCFTFCSLFLSFYSSTIIILLKFFSNRSISSRLSFDN